MKRPSHGLLGKPHRDTAAGHLARALYDAAALSKAADVEDVASLLGDMADQNDGRDAEQRQVAAHAREWLLMITGKR